MTAIPTHEESKAAVHNLTATALEKLVYLTGYAKITRVDIAPSIIQAAVDEVEAAAYERAACIVDGYVTITTPSAVARKIRAMKPAPDPQETEKQ